MLKFGDIVNVCLRPFKGFSSTNSFSCQYGFVNFKTTEGARKLLASQLSSPELLALVEFKHKNKIYIFFAQTKRQRKEYTQMVQNSYAMFKNQQMHMTQIQPPMQKILEPMRQPF